MHDEAGKDGPGPLLTVEELEQLRQRVSRETLEHYDSHGTWQWFVLTGQGTGLAEVAYAFETKDLTLLARLIGQGALRICGSLRSVSGREFECIYYRDAVFFLKEVESRRDAEGNDGSPSFE